jgi:hypothetical protein
MIRGKQAIDETTAAALPQLPANWAGEASFARTLSARQSRSRCPVAGKVGAWQSRSLNIGLIEVPSSA